MLPAFLKQPVTRDTSTRVDTVTGTVDELAVTVTETTSVIDGISGQWGVSVDINGKVIGLVKLDGSATGSTFTVLADKFIIRRPSTTDDIQAFVVGLVNGTTTVGINGNLVVDDTILARHINVSTLSAIVADVGTLTAGLIQSANGKVEFDLTDGRLRILS